jgi:hypothetical protein
MKNKITEILQHDISWFVDSTSVKELDECSIEHIEECIKDGLSQGQLCVTYGKYNDKETTGWWHIIDWQGLALGLYNAFEPFKDNPTQKEAVKRFNDEWSY